MKPDERTNYGLTGFVYRVRLSLARDVSKPPIHHESHSKYIGNSYQNLYYGRTMSQTSDILSIFTTLQSVGRVCTYTR